MKTYHNKLLISWITILVLVASLIPCVLLLNIVIPGNDNLFLSTFILFLIGLWISLYRLISYETERKTFLANVDPYCDKVEEIVYSSGQDELRFTKNLQWNLIYYFLLVFGVLYALSEGINVLKPNLHYVCSYLIFIMNCAVLVYGIYFICELQYKLRDYRISLDKTKIYINGFYENGVFNEKRYQNEKEEDMHFWRNPRISIAFMISISIAFILISVRVWDQISQLVNNLFK